MTGLRPLNEVLQKAACEQLFEKPEQIQGDLETLKTWIKQQPHLRARTDDQWLIAFLRGCKYSLEKTKSKLDQFYTLKSKFPELFMCTDVVDPQFRQLLREGSMLLLPTPLNENGPRIMIMREGIFPANKYPMDLMMRLSSAMQEIMLLEDDYANVFGVIFILDSAGASAAHWMQWTPSLMKKMTVYSEEALPLRPKANHFVNTFAGFEPIFNMFKPMLSKKQQSRLFVHGSKMELLHKEIPKKYLPKEYGGDNGSVADIVAEWEKKFDEYSEYFKQEGNYGTDEKLRPGKPIDFENLFGLDGSFRKLDVD